MPGRNAAFSKIIDLEMLVLPGAWNGLKMNFASYSPLGFRLERIIPTPGIQCIIEGVPV